MRPSHEDPALHALLGASPAAQVEWLRARGLPAAVLLPVQNACAQRCFFCAGPGTSDLAAAAPPDPLLAHLAARPPGVDRLLLGGNEPTLHPAFERLLAAAVAAGFRRIDLMTNGATLAENAARWADRGVAEVVVPLYGATAAVHDAVAGVACFNRVIAGLDAAHRAGIAVRVHTVLLRRTLRELPALAALVQDRFGTRLAAGLLRAKPGFDWTTEAPTFGEIRAALRSLPAPPTLLVAPTCLRWGNGDGVTPGSAPADEPPALLAHLYFSSQSRRFLPDCVGCPARETCAGVVDAYA